MQTISLPVLEAGEYAGGIWYYEPHTYQSYRYVLGRVGKHPLVCIGINPSTAQPGALDPTLKSVERLAAANGIANANLIRPGQVLTIPPLAQLPAAAARPPSAKIAAATKVREVKEEESGTARLVPWVPENTVKSLADLELDKIASGGGLWQSTRW